MGHIEKIVTYCEKAKGNYCIYACEKGIATMHFISYVNENNVQVN